MRTVTINNQKLRVKKEKNGVYTSFYRKGVLCPEEHPKYITIGAFDYKGEHVAYTVKDSVFPSVLFALVLGFLLLTCMYVYLPTYLKTISYNPTVTYYEQGNYFATEIDTGLIPINAAIRTRDDITRAQAILPYSKDYNLKGTLTKFQGECDAVLVLSMLDAVVEKPIKIVEAHNDR